MRFNIIGECKARPGTEFLSDISGESVIIPFRRADKDLALVFSDSVLQLKTFNANGKMIDFVPSTATRVVWTNTDNNTPSTTPLSVTGSITGDTSIVYKYWTLDSYTLTTNYTNNRIFINQMANPWTKFTMRFTAKKALNTVGMEVYPADGNWDQRYLDSVKEWVQDAVLQYSDDGTNWTTAQLASSAYWSVKREATPAGELYVRVLNFDLLQTDLHEYWQVVVIWNRQNMLNNAPVMVRFADTVYEQTTSAVSALTTPYTVNLLKKLKYSQQDNELIICDGQHNPYKFYMNGNVPHWEEQNTYSFLATDGVPSCVRFFQNRLFFGGFDAFPNRVRGSKFATDSDRSHYNDFTVVHQNATVADPINVECNQFSERITDLWGGFTVLYAQSSEGIAFVTGMSATPDFTLRCSERAAGITPTMKDNIMYYVGFDKRKIYAFSFDNNIQQFVAPDISQYWQEVLKNRISEIHYVDSRCKCVIGSLEDGTGFFLLHEGSMVGYFPFDISGQIYDVSVLKDGDDMHVIFVVNRENYWSIERLHLPEFMLETNAFEQTNWERNLATQKNLLKSPYFDSWRELSNEHNELWEYNAETKILSPAPATTNPVDLSSYVGDVVRCYYGDGIRDYTEARIDRVYSEQQTITEEIEVTENIYWYGWSNTTAITVAAIPGNDPAINGTLPRNSINDEQYYKAWYYAPLSKDYWTHDENPDIGKNE